LGLVAPFAGCVAASALHSSSSFRSQAMQPPSPVQGLRQKAAIGAVENDGGNNARTDTHRTDAPDADRTLRSRGTDHERTLGISRRLARARQCAYEPAQHSLGSRAARLLALSRAANAPAGANRQGQEAEDLA